MGDRAQIQVKNSKNTDTGIFLYAHWDGSIVYRAAAAGIAKAPDRHEDEEYLARVIFQKLVGDDDETTGYGIGTQKHGDIEHPLLVVDCGKQVVTFERGGYGGGGPKGDIPFSDFIKRAEAGEFDDL